MKVDNESFNQIKGMTMGTFFAPTDAALSVGYFEIKFYNISNLKYGQFFVDYIKEN